VKPRTLVVVTVYDGRAFVPRCLNSAARLDTAATDCDVLVLDDCSPEPGWSADLERLCRKHGLSYYRSPRNLGIVRNVNLGLGRALSGEYDHVLIANSDIILPRTLLTSLIGVVSADSNIGSVTAWSNSASIYSLPNEDSDGTLADQENVDWLTTVLTAEFTAAAMDIPVAVGFCMLIPTRALRRVGLLDPVFGRGYCEENDWSLRSKALGYRVVLAPGAFVYHSGSGSTRAAGMLEPGHKSVPFHEAILDQRYPLFRSQVDGFMSSDMLPGIHRGAIARILKEAAATWGYTVEVSWLPPRCAAIEGVRCVLSPQGRNPSVGATFRGFSLELPIDGMDIAGSLTSFFGSDPASLRILDRGAHADRLTELFGRRDVSIVEDFPYPRPV